MLLWAQYCQWWNMPVVEFLATTSAQCAVLWMEKIFTTYGVPEVIKSDNGPLLTCSKRFVDFAEEQGFKHRKVTPGWAEANGDVCEL